MLIRRLQADRISFQIGDNSIVDRVDMTLEAGESVGLIGPNGAGKTTLIDLLSGFRQPTRGSVHLSGRNVTRTSPDRRTRSGMARTFQESPAIPGLTVGEHLQLAYGAAGRRRRDADEALPGKLINRLLLGHLHGAAAQRLPIADRRVVDLGRALATVPDVLLLDEPFAGLTREYEEVLIREIDRLKQRGGAALIVEHRLALLNHVVDRVIVMVNGTKIASGSLDAVLKDSQVREAYLGEGVGET